MKNNNHYHHNKNNNNDDDNGNNNNSKEIVIFCSCAIFRALKIILILSYFTNSFILVCRKK